MSLFNLVSVNDEDSGLKHVLRPTNKSLVSTFTAIEDGSIKKGCGLATANLNHQT